MSNYKRIFMDGYSYFITVVTHGRNPILIENIALLRESFHVSKQKYAYKIDAIVILPDHFHMIITPKHADEYPHIIRVIKQHFSKHCSKRDYAHLYQSWSREKKGYSLIWQKRFYEHTIRDEKDYVRCLEYIRNNPLKHKYVENEEFEKAEEIKEKIDSITRLITNQRIFIYRKNSWDAVSVSKDTDESMAAVSLFSYREGELMAVNNFVISNIKYLKNKEILSDCNRSLWIVFSPNNLNKKVNPKLLFRDVKPDMIDLLKKLRDNI